MKQRTIFGLGLLMSFAGAMVAQTTVTEKPWGSVDGKPVALFTVADKDLTVNITTYGARVVALDAPDRNGAKADVVLGYNNVGQFAADKSTYFGAIVGRYGNRIAKGTYKIDGNTYHAPMNDHGINMLHGGTLGFDKKIWTGTKIPNGVEMSLISPDGDMGFPGQLTVHVKYVLEGKTVRIDYTATTTKPTVVNLTNHSYFNLGGEGNGTILNELLTIPADNITPIDAGLIPTGKLMPVAGTPFDFRKPTPIGARINQSNEQLKLAGGYDHNFVLNGPIGTLHLAAVVADPVSGRTLTIRTTQPGVQFYSGNFLDGSLTGAGGVKYVKHAGLALETQHFPDSPNEPSFPSTVLRPGQTLHSTTTWTFGVQ